MSDPINFKRGSGPNPLLLTSGEPSFDLTNKLLYVGTGSENVLINASLATLSGIAQDMTQIVFGSDGPEFNFDTVQTPDTLVVGLDDTTSNTLLVIEKNNIGQDYGHAQQPRPTVFIHSETDAGVATNEWVGLLHDTDDAVIQSGKGAVKFDSASDEIDINDHAVINSGSSPINLGIAGSPTFVTDPDDIYIDKDLEIAGTVYFGGTVSGLNLGGSFGDDDKLYFGDSDDSSIVFVTTQDQDALWLGVDLASRHLHVGDESDSAVNYGLGPAADPTIYLHSSSGGDINQWLSIAHAQTEAKFVTGEGGISLEPANSIVSFGGTTNAYPALKRSATALQVKLADDSAFTTMEASIYKASGRFEATDTNGQYLWTGKSRLSSPLDGNIRLTDSAQTDFGLLQLGGTTSAYPAWKRNGTVLEARRADDSIFTGVSAYQFIAGSFVMGPAAMQLGETSVLYWKFRTAINSPVDGDLLLQNSANDDFGLIQLGGTTSSFPALKKSGGTIHFRLADDSAYTGLIAARSNFVAPTNSIALEVSGASTGNAYLRFVPGLDDGIHFAVNGTTEFGNNNLIITTLANATKDHDHDTLSADPTLFIHSNSDPDADNTQWGSLTHDQTDFVISSGTGNIQLSPASHVGIDSGTRFIFNADSATDTYLTGGDNSISCYVGGNLVGTMDAGRLGMRDAKQVSFGSGDDYWFVYNSTSTQFEFWTTDADGIGTDGTIFSIQDGTDDVDFKGNIALQTNGRVEFNGVGSTTYMVSIGASILRTYVQNSLSVQYTASGLTIPVNNSIVYGSSNYWHKYNATGTQFEFWSGDIDGIGTDGLIFSIVDGTKNITLADGGLLQFGGETASYPALKRNGTELQVRLADDSDFSSITTSAFVMDDLSRMSATASGVMLLQNDAETDFNLLQFGGTTASFPALKRLGTGIQVRLATDLGWANLQADQITCQGGFSVGDVTESVRWFNRSRMYSDADSEIDFRDNAGTAPASLRCSRLVEANTAGSGTPNALDALESRKVFTNEGVTAQNYHDLPTAAAGISYTFVVQDSDGIRVDAAAGDTIRVAGSVSAAAGRMESTTIGDAVTIVAINATEWVAVNLVGTGWTVT